MSMVIVALLAAQVHVGQNKDDVRFSAERAREMISSYGKCIAKARSPMAREFVLESANASEEKLFKGMSSCLAEGTGIRFRHASARGAMAEYLIGKDYPGIPTLKLDGVVVSYAPETFTLTRDGVPVPMSELTPAVLAQLREAGADPILKLGDCLLRADQPAARALIASKLNKADEDAAVASLTPALQSCVPKGKSLQIDKTGLRTGVAVAYYRLARAINGAAQ